MVLMTPRMAAGYPSTVPKSESRMIRAGVPVGADPWDGPSACTPASALCGDGTFERADHLVRNRHERTAGVGLGCRDGGRPAFVTGDAHLGIEWYGAEQCEVHVLREHGATAVTEHVDMLAAMRAVHTCHVLDDAEQRCANTLEHADGASHVTGRNVLRCGDEHRTLHVDRLHERKLRVTGSGRHVDDQVIEFAPLDLLDELLQDAGDERTAHDRWLLRLEEKAEAHQLHAMTLEGNDLLFTLRTRDPWPTFFTEHERDVGSVDVGVQQTDAQAPVRESSREVHRDRGLADAALARADGHNVVDVLRQLRIGLWCRYRMRLPLALLRLRRVRQLDVDLHLADATNGLG